MTAPQHGGCAGSGTYRVRVPDTAAPGPSEPTGDDLALRSIRDALLPEEVDDFDREFRPVMSEAADTLDLTGVLQFRRRWRRVAYLQPGQPDGNSADDPQGCSRSNALSALLVSNLCPHLGVVRGSVAVAGWRDAE